MNEFWMELCIGKKCNRFSEIEFENIQLISRKELLSDLSSVIKCTAALTLPIKCMSILWYLDKSNFWEAFTDHISPQWFLSPFNSSVTLWITPLNSVYMLLNFVPCIQSYLINKIGSSSRAEIRPHLFFILPQVLSTSVCHGNTMLNDSVNQVPGYYSLWYLDP